MPRVNDVMAQDRAAEGNAGQSMQRQAPSGKELAEPEPEGRSLRAFGVPPRPYMQEDAWIVLPGPERAFSFCRWALVFTLWSKVVFRAEGPWLGNYRPP